MTFVVGDDMDDLVEPVKRFTTGEIRSYEEYLRMREAMHTEFPDGHLRPEVWIYDRPWDFMWSTTNSIIVSERIKQRAEREGLVGVSFELFEDAQIVTSTTA